MSIGSLASILLIIVVILYALWKRANLYLLLAVAIILIFIFSVLSAAYKPYVGTSPMFLELSFKPGDLQTINNLYTIITSMFLHADLYHLIFNLFALIFIGSVLEGRIGTFRFFALYFITGIIGTLTFAVFNLNTFFILIGASGAISGLLGALARLYPRERMTMFFGFGITPPLPAYIIVIIFLLIETLLAFMRNDSIAHLAHIGGAVSGFLLAPLIARLEMKKIHTEARTEILGSLATTSELKEMLERIEHEDDESVRKAWLEQFHSKISCPNCKKGLRRKRDVLYCEYCGWKTKIYR